jgi:hypothetical protein
MSILRQLSGRSGSGIRLDKSRASKSSVFKAGIYPLQWTFITDKPPPFFIVYIIMGKGGRSYYEGTKEGHSTGS